MKGQCALSPNSSHAWPKARRMQARRALKSIQGFQRIALPSVRGRKLNRRTTSVSVHGAAVLPAIAWQ